MYLLTGLRHIIDQLGEDKTYWVAYSGGLDSHVLLSLCHQLSREQSLSFRVLHVNHGLSPNASDWARHCSAICENYQLPYEQINIHIHSASGESLEEIAREQRYAAFALRMQKNDVLLTGHHQGDQAETLLLQLLRGSGVKGLSAMPAIKLFGQGVHARPLLGYTRDEIKQYAVSRQLNWIEDESNQNEKFSRNYLRHHIMPLLRQRWPAVDTALSRSAAYCAEAQSLLNDYGSILCEQVQGAAPGTLSVSGLLTLDESRQKLVLRTWIEAAGYPLPDSKKMHAIVHDVLTADRDRFPLVCWGDTELRRYRDHLHVMARLPEHDSSQYVHWDLSHTLSVSGIGDVHAGQIISNTVLANDQVVEVRFRQGGEMIELAGRGRQFIKNLFQEWSIAPWLRDRVPLIYVNGKLVGVVVP